MTWKAIVPILVLLASAACGSDNSSSVVPAKQAPQATVAPAASAAPASSPTASAPAAAAGSMTVKLSDFKIDPASVTVKTGTSITVKNDGPTPHNLVIRDASGKMVANTPDLKPGESKDLLISLPPGSYTQYCSLAGHESLGMKGTFTVQ